jgi:hypothetical protein
LLWYSAIYCFTQVLMFGSPIIFCLFRYPGTRHFARDGARRDTLSELLSFSGWNLFGTLAYVIRVQGPAILLNMFSGTVANSAYGVATQANAFASNVSGGVLRATSPPIVKREAVADRNGARVLSNLSNTYSFGILWIAIAPVIIEYSFCLRVWLHKVPPDTSVFVRLLLVALLIDQLTSGYMAPLQATGRIAAYQIVVGAMNCIGVFVGYVLLRLGWPAASVLWAVAGGCVLAGFGRLWFASNRAHISVRSWLGDVLSPCAICATSSSCAIIAVMRLMSPGVIRFAVVVVINVIVSGLVMWHFGTPTQQRSKLRAMIGLFESRSLGTIPS